MQQTVLITGGNANLGYECAKTIALSSPDYHIVLACRNAKSANEAATQLKTSTNNPNISTVLLDLASLDSVKTCAETLVAQLNDHALPPLTAIIANAGIQFGDQRRATPSGIEETFAINHLGHFALINRILAHLEPHGRIAVVSSGTHHNNPRDFLAAAMGVPAPLFTSAKEVANGTATGGLTGTMLNRRYYATSKLCNLFFTYELNRRLKAKNLSIVVNAFDPGLMPGTNLARNNSPALVWAWHNVLPIFTGLPGISHVEASGQNLARLVLDASLAGVSGQYFVETKAVTSSTESQDRAKQQDLWQLSVSLTETDF
jgi:NAD(P)-dependent dehydrogenase (short-subunit alcohol dehydrogenase family)